ncbi:AAA family ATPase [Oerskovia rustica]|uniref:AAA family ATPase n=1 Tax=Oerskovia rustica TaxID=2762237 RepID=A0ABR8RW56_9CELL|nr:AAA family ATPase [Oerskovia rustica]MBD7952037.1 AAA family ATPase [Oerskovia rustica]
MSDPRGDLVGIHVRGLFGRSDYDIALDQRRPTVLTGANGTGKSTLLRIINAVSAGDAYTLAHAPLNEFHLEFQAGPDFSLSRHAAGGSTVRWGNQRGTIDWPELDSEFPEWAISALLEQRELSEPLDQTLREYARAANASFEEFDHVRKYFRSTRQQKRRPDAPEWLHTISEHFPVLYITDQRLIASTEDEGRKASQSARGITRRLAVEAAATDIARRIQEADSAYTRVSLQEDRRFPGAVIDAMNSGRKVDTVGLGELVDEVDAKRDALRSVGLLDSDDSYQPDLDPASIGPQVAPVIETFLMGATRKMEVLDDLAGKLSAFRKFIDGRFTGKRAILSRESGLRFALGDGTEIRPSELSSGEQQITVLAFEILFKTSPSTLVLVDEPELSLHVLWQDTLIDDLHGMGRASQLQFLMATHAPAILANHPELERSLDRH